MPANGARLIGGIGLVALIVGIAMIPLPGPGFIPLILGAVLLLIAGILARS